MLKRRSMIFYVLLIAALGCTHASNRVEAEEPPIKIKLLPGDNTVECKFLKKDPPTYIEIIRGGNLCADRVFHRITKDCSDEKYKEPIKPVEEGKIPIPKTASGTGNQYCPEAIVHYENSPYCFQYTSGGRTRYIPRG